MSANQVIKAVIVRLEDGSEHVITGDVRYERTIRANAPWSDVTIRIPNASVVLGAGVPDEIQLAACHVCGAPQGPLRLGGAQ